MPLTVGVFLAAAFFRAHILQNAAASPFLQKPYGKSGKKAKARFCLFAKVCLNNLYIANAVALWKNKILSRGLISKHSRYQNFIVKTYAKSAPKQQFRGACALIFEITRPLRRR
ncbi:MAG TPA: hypothetical protein H9729_05935 [Candidatus Borkfalkia excrementigallinarum]|uniref:Uncharacterized protein n=1 Tax=Candidatus Borkfalkia excrementigallinarum TaxID=2838506 RepID=A0A9D1ZW15_9FIRM|nr:hypothetical protein [Candidatus Borkfalkia excrementigallinarum]